MPAAGQSYLPGHLGGSRACLGGELPATGRARQPSAWSRRTRAGPSVRMALPPPHGQGLEGLCCCPGSLHGAGSPFSPAWLLMSSASKWPLPVTHSAFCAPEAVVLSFTLESNRTRRCFLRCWNPRVAVIAQQRSAHAGGPSASALIVKTPFSETDGGPSEGGRSAVSRNTFLWGFDVFSSRSGRAVSLLLFVFLIHISGGS